MALITKLAWLALPVLAGCAVVSQVSGAQAGSNGRVALPEYPEDKDYLAIAGVRRAEQYAKYANPNLGLTEQELGITRAQLKQVEANIKAAIIARPIDDVAREIKKTKYGINAADSYIAAPEGMSQDDWRKKNLADYNAGKTETVNAIRQELSNAQKTPASINGDIADYLDELALKAISNAGVGNPNKLLAAKAFVLAAHYAVNQAEYKSINYTMGMAQGPMHDAVTAKGMYVLDVAREVCYGKAVSFGYIVDSKSSKHNVAVEVRYVNLKGSTLKGYNFGGVDYSHMDNMVTFNGVGKTEFYDATEGLIYDSADIDSAVGLVAGSHGFIRQRPYTDPNHKFFRISDGDPASSLSLTEYLRIPVSIGMNARRAIPRRSIGN